jgi:hypothetical protein
MTPSLQLLPDTEVRSSGVGPIVSLSEFTGQLLQIQISINRILERESVDLSLWASPDGQDWGARPVLRFPRRYHCGTCHFVMDLEECPDARFLRIEYRLNPSRDNHESLAAVSVQAEPAPEHAFAAAY